MMQGWAVQLGWLIAGGMAMACASPAAQPSDASCARHSHAAQSPYLSSVWCLIDLM